MTGNTDHMVTDLTRHLCEDIQSVINRHMGVIQPVLLPVDVMQVMLRVSSNVGFGTILYALQARRDEADVEQICDTVIAGIQNAIAAGKPLVLAQLAAIEKAVA